MVWVVYRNYINAVYYCMIMSVYNIACCKHQHGKINAQSVTTRLSETQCSLTIHNQIINNTVSQHLGRIFLKYKYSIAHKSTCMLYYGFLRKIYSHKNSL